MSSQSGAWWFFLCGTKGRCRQARSVCQQPAAAGVHVIHSRRKGEENGKRYACRVGVRVTLPVRLLGAPEGRCGHTSTAVSRSVQLACAPTLRTSKSTIRVLQSAISVLQSAKRETLGSMDKARDSCSGMRQACRGGQPRGTPSANAHTLPSRWPAARAA